MEKSEALELFLEKEAKSLSIEFVVEAMSCLEKGKRQDIIKQFGDSICCVLAAAPGLQFFQIALIRSNTFLCKPFYRLEAYGPDFYLSEPLFETELEVNWLYEAYFRFAFNLEKDSRKYIAMIGKPELDRIKLAELHNCQKIIKYLFAETVVYLIHSTEYKALKTEEKIQFHLAEYMGPYDILMTKDEDMDLMGGIVDELLLAAAADRRA